MAPRNYLEITNETLQSIVTFKSLVYKKNVPIYPYYEATQTAIFRSFLPLQMAMDYATEQRRPNRHSPRQLLLASSFHLVIITYSFHAPTPSSTLAPIFPIPPESTAAAADSPHIGPAAHFNARRYASAAYTVVVCLCVSACLSNSV